ncbi:hypothetical protein VFPFJ_07627 [Purpureocillium lilacinum]|uniref:2EXR domain-containing protein n=1 Tax=Purpureocillium lilacinum TaxID=33203 RepID=A0A179H659_PURLI|nr:hypothetical protein VFPFJ_07627 [Purpureocillium lilacinum]OAQ85238.1 hypothetical protein VFPFJ_07627 [Purpureocillium lilacinum]
MAPDRHLEIINPSHGEGPKAAFGSFLKLPVELQLAIWNLALKRNRLLEIEIRSLADLASEDEEGSPPCTAARKSYEMSSFTGYGVVIRGVQLNSVLFSVSHEVRRLALDFYRVHLPCLAPAHNEYSREPPVQKLLYFNPEHDYVRPYSNTYDAPLVMDFIHDLKAHDPRHVGLVNMGVGSFDLGHYHMLADEDDAHRKAVLADTISQLREVIWMADSDYGRGINGPMDDLQGFSDVNGVGVRFNHSMPIKPLNVAFDLLDKDPRPIGPELEFVATCSGNPRRFHIPWEDLMRRCRINGPNDNQREPRTRILFSYTPWPYGEQIVDSESARRFVKKEEERWLDMQRSWDSSVTQHASKVPIEGPEELARATRPAIGFWLFPAEALGPIDGNMLDMKVVFDLREHWPQLALSELS